MGIERSRMGQHFCPVQVAGYGPLTAGLEARTQAAPLASTPFSPPSQHIVCCPGLLFPHAFMTKIGLFMVTENVRSGPACTHTEQDM